MTDPRMELRDLEQRSQRLSLKPPLVAKLTNGTLYLEQIRVCTTTSLDATAKRLEGLNMYADDEGVVSEGPEAYRALLDPDLLDGNGCFLVERRSSGADVDVGYALWYDVRNEDRTGLPSHFRQCSERADWTTVRRHVRETCASSPARLLLHHYDYATLPTHRRLGIGRLLLDCGLSLWPDDAMAVGFIDSSSSRVDSVLAATRAGCVIGREVDSSPDGPHASFLEIYSQRGFKLDWSSRVIHRAGDPLDGLAERIRHAVASGIVAYRTDTECLEQALARQHDPDNATASP